MSNQLNIGIFLDGDKYAGGGFQQQLSSAIDLQQNLRHNLIFFTQSTDVETELRKHDIKSTLIYKNPFDKIFLYLHGQPWFARICQKYKVLSNIEKRLSSYKLDLLYFLYPSELATLFKHHNYIITVWDLCHLDHMEFPEVNFNWEFELREHLYTSTLRKAIAIIVDSEVGALNLARRYNVDTARIHHTPFYISNGIENPRNNSKILKNLDLISQKYIFYPAQFWAHKNHIYILDALKSLNLAGINISCVFTGSDKGSLKNIQAYSKKMNLSEQIRFPGYVSDEDLYCLYKNALALVMPTYFGPTNIPPLEAIKMGIPVICSEIKGHQELLGDAALYCNLDYSDSLTGCIKKLISDENARNSLITNGYKIYRKLEQESLSQLISKICDSYSIKCRSWSDYS